jgi:hypothetical protein
MTEQDKSAGDDRVVAAEIHSEFVATTATEGDVTRGLVGKVTEKKTFRDTEGAGDDMPLPTDPKTVFLGGLFGLACMAGLYVASEVVLPLILAIVLKLLLQPLVRVLERIHIPRALGAVVSVLLVLTAFGGTISVLAGPAAAWAGKLPEAIPKVREGLGFLKQPIDALQGMMHQVESLTGGGAGGPQTPAVKPSSLLGAGCSAAPPR